MASQPAGAGLNQDAPVQWEALGWKEPEMIEIVTSVVRLYRILLRESDKALRPLNVTFSRYEILALIFSQPHPLSLGKIGEYLRIHPTSVTGAVDKLELDGLVRRMPHESDRRTIVVEITAAGRRVVRRGTVALADTAIMAGVTPKDITQLNAILRRARVALGAS
jgi:DNA-binding MarR family transcriptional regulator